MILTTDIEYDATGIASDLAGEARYALGQGDTLLAAEKYSEAAKVFEVEAAASRKSSKKHFLLFLAASHYYHGGHYKQALKLGRRIEERHLPENVRPLFPEFAKDIETRADAGYAKSTFVELLRLRDSGKYVEALELLKHHQFFVDRARLAFFRGYLLDYLSKHVAAAQFYKKLIEFSSDLPGALALASSYTATMMIANKFDTATDYIRAQISILGNPISYLSAAILTRGLAELETNLQRRRDLIAKFNSYFHAGQEGFLKLPPECQNSPELRLRLETVTAAEIVSLIEECEWSKTEVSLRHALTAFPDSSLFKEIQKRLPDEIQAHNSTLNFSNFLNQRNREVAERMRSWSRVDNLAA